MAKPGSHLRLFVAIYPSPGAAQAMIDAVRSIELPPHRITPIEQLHITVQFIGDTPSARIEDTVESVQRAASGLKRFTLKPERLITLPERGPARLIAAELTSHPTLIEIHRRLVVRLAKEVRAKRGDRFRPHITLCRFRAPVRSIQIDQTLEAPSFDVSHLSLMRSALSSSGAVHHQLASIDL